MPVTLDMSLDYLVWDNPEAVTFESVGRVGPALLAVPVAKRRALGIKDLAGGVYTPQDVAWHIPAKMVPIDFEGKPSDIIVDKEARRWTALEVQRNKLRHTWRFVCRDLVLAHDLRDKITIERASISNDASGAYVKAFPTGPGAHGGKNLYTDLAARFQPDSEDVVDQRGVRGTVLKGRFIVAKQISVLPKQESLDVAEDRVLWIDRYGSTHYFDIVAYQNAERIDELPALVVEERP